jgi:uncharacterized protein
VRFEWNEEKAKVNKAMHGVDFATAQLAFDDPKGIVQFDAKHSKGELRWFYHGKVNGRVLTVRYTQRGQSIRLIGAGYWRSGRENYEKNAT